METTAVVTILCICNKGERCSSRKPTNLLSIVKNLVHEMHIQITFCYYPTFFFFPFKNNFFLWFSNSALLLAPLYI